MIALIEPPCGVPAHRMGRWDDVVLGIWWCPDCGEAIWTTEEVERAGADLEAARADERPRGSDAAPVPDLRDPAANRGDPAGALGDRARRDGGARAWHLIVERFGGGLR